MICDNVHQGMVDIHVTTRNPKTERTNFGLTAVSIGWPLLLPFQAEVDPCTG
jgi:hypothetical protein